jgi:hypothetical protein
MFTKISEFIFGKATKVSGWIKGSTLRSSTTKDGKIIRSNCVKLSMDSNENDLKERVGIAMSEDLWSHEPF